jgi:hypothetical protein
MDRKDHSAWHAPYDPPARPSPTPGRILEEADERVNPSTVPLVAALVALVAIAAGLVVLVYRTKARERTLTTALDRSSRAAREADVRAKLIDDRLQQALARLHALADVEQRYRGVLDVEALVANLRAQGVMLEAQQAEQRLAHRQELDRLAAEVDRLRHQLVALSDEEYFADFGIYSTRYDFPTSDRYRAALDDIRARQKHAVKNGAAAICRSTWTVQGSEAQGRKMTSDNLKMLIRAFNGECDAAITKVTYKNVAAIEQRIWKTKEQLDRLNAVHHCELTEAYVRLKIEELHLFYEHERKKEDERQEQRELREQIRDEQRAQQELDKARKQAEDDEARYQAALAKAREDAQRTVGAKHAKLEAKIAELEARLLEAQANKRAISMAQQTRAGHVYVISNVGSFGDGVYKIGMTRRPEPKDRVRELGDASVPFLFDVHAMIRSQDAPTLERALHRRFADRRTNLVNERKEFFNVTLEEIAAAVAELHGEIELIKVAEAAEYRQSVALRRQRASSSPSTGMVSQRSAAPTAASHPAG